MAETKTTFPMYKGRPLVRCGDMLYYGDMRDNYVVRIQIKAKKKVSPVGAEGDAPVKELEVATKTLVQLMNTDITVDPKKMIVKTDEQPSLFGAIDTAYVWLQQAQRENS